MFLPPRRAVVCLACSVLAHQLLAVDLGFVPQIAMALTSITTPPPPLAMWLSFELHILQPAMWPSPELQACSLPCDFLFG